jgi:hypothetical protein
VKLVGSRGSAQPTVHKFTASARDGVRRPVPSLSSIGRGKPRSACASRGPDADVADYTSRRTRQGCASFDAIGGCAQVDPFVLRGPPQALDKDVVVAAPASVHADLDPVIPQHFGKLVAGELRALISIEDAGIAEPSEGFAQRLDTKPRGQRVLTAARAAPGGSPSR